MVTTVTWWWGCWVSVGAGTMTVGWCVEARGAGGACTWRQRNYFKIDVFHEIQVCSVCVCVCVSDLWTVCLSVY